MAGDVPVTLRVREDRMNGSLMNSSENNAKQTVNDTAAAFANKPDFKKYVICLEPSENTEATVYVRIPEWINAKAKVLVNGELIKETDNTAEFVKIKRVWDKEDRVTVILPIGLKFITLPDDETVGAYRYGADVLAGVCKEERVLKVTGDPCKELTADTERQWGDFRTFYKTENQDPGINFIKLNEVGYEPYQVYFKVKNK
jgi:hypothetical protein